MGFELLTENNKVFYPLAADNETDLDKWVETLNKAIAVSQRGETGDKFSGDISSFYAKETLKDAKKVDIAPDLLEHSSGTDSKNAHNRYKDSHPLFHVYPELMVCIMLIL